MRTIRFGNRVREYALKKMVEGVEEGQTLVTQFYWPHLTHPPPHF